MEYDDIIEALKEALFQSYELGTNFIHSDIKLCKGEELSKKLKPIYDKLDIEDKITFDEFYNQMEKISERFKKEAVSKGYAKDTTEGFAVYKGSAIDNEKKGIIKKTLSKDLVDLLTTKIKDFLEYLGFQPERSTNKKMENFADKILQERQTNQDKVTERG